MSIILNLPKRLSRGAKASFNEADTAASIQGTSTVDRLEKPSRKSIRCSSMSISSSQVLKTGASSSQVLKSAASSSSKPTLPNDIWSDFQAILLSYLNKKKVTIKGVPEGLDFASYAVQIEGNNHSLETDDRESKLTNSKALYLRSYHTNLLKVEPYGFKGNKERVFLYTTTAIEPTKLGKIKRVEKGTQIYDAKRTLLYVLEELDEIPTVKKPVHKRLFSSFACSSSVKTPTLSPGMLRLKDAKTGKAVKLGSYHVIQMISNDKEKVFNTLCYEIEFPSDFSEEAKTLIMASLMSKIPKTVTFRQIK